LIRTRRSRIWPRAVALFLAWTLSTGCAQVDTNGTRRHTGPRLPPPREVVVYDFRPTRAQPSQGAEPSDGLRSPAERALRTDVGKALADVVAEELRDRGIVANRRTGPIVTAPDSMAIGGHVVEIDEGSDAKRIFIGFGSGRSSLATAGQLYGRTENGMILLWEYQNTAASGAKPGILTTLPIGMAVQGVTALVFLLNGGMATLGELSSTSSANAKRMAKEMADEVERSIERVTLPPS